MTNTLPVEVEAPVSRRGNEPGFTETPAWETVGSGWRPLHGGFCDVGYSVEWHDFSLRRDLEWSRSFHPGSLEICLNVAGEGEVRAGRRSLELSPSTAGFYAQSGAHLAALRRGGGRHQFITIELSLPFLERHGLSGGKGLNPRLGAMFGGDGCGAAVVSEPVRLSSAHRQMVMNLRRPPVVATARPLWYRAKALELAAELLFQPLPGEELFCRRYQRLSQERAQKVMAILKENLAEPPALEEIGRRVGCSHFHLSRLFTRETGRTISAHLRGLRMERAAELLREGRMNVTEAAFEVGYSSLSHFTVAFRETFNCCPGLYPLKARRGAK